MWCDLLSEALAALWSCSVTSDPTRWLRWNPVDPETQKDLTPRPGAENMVLSVNLSLVADWECQTSCWWITWLMLLSGPSVAE